VPLVILAACAVFAGLLQTPGMWPVKTELFKEWVEPGAVIVPVESTQPGGDQAMALVKVSEPGRSVRLPEAEGGSEAEEGGTDGGHGGAVPAPGQAQFFPALSHPPFSVPKALLSVAIALAGIGLGLLACRAVYERNLAAGLTRRNRLVGAGYRFLANKYYLDDLYEKVVVAGISGPIARAANWFNQRVLDGVVNGVGVGGREAGVWLYKNIDQAVVDGAVNGAGSVAEGSGGLLRTLQSGRVSQYGALLFGATAVAALVLVLVV
jgi:NADH-quinone oxidoreductase subunit L